MGSLQRGQGFKRVGSFFLSSTYPLTICSPAKPSRPARAYLHLTKQDYLQLLSNKVRETAFIDAKGSGGDSALLGPPVVEFSSYPRVPTSKPRKDARLGTIDQDPEFIEFLESLTNPIPKPAPVDFTSDKENKADEKKVTPLIQFLRDKKANKGKEGATSKVVKSGRQEAKDSKGTQVSDKKILAKATKENVTSQEKKGAVRIEKKARDNGKSAVKQASDAKKGPPAASSQAPNPASTTAAPKPERKRERGSASAAAKILQRDLGLAGTSPSRRKRESAATTAANGATPTSSTNKEAMAPSPSKPVKNPPQNSTVTSPTASTAETVPPSASLSAPATAPKAPTKPPTGPAKGRNQPKPGRSQQTPLATIAPPPATVPPVTGTQAFLKHANPSQGITEPLLEEAFAPFGSVTNVEIDKKKGFAYIDFGDTESLQKAIAASPVKVAQGQVVVLERKTGASLQNRNARGGGNAGGAQPGARGGRGSGGRSRGGRGGKLTGKVATSTTGDSTPTVTSPTFPPASAIATAPTAPSGDGP